jgi:molybdate transport system regulatory protein
MKTSARNQFIAKVSGLRHSEVSTEVRLRVDEGMELTAMITRESAEGLGLSTGAEVHAFVKAPSVILSTERRLRTSARNHLRGTIKRIHLDSVNAEVTLAIPGGRTVTALITKDSAESLGLEVGRSVSALFKASSVILATIG